MTIAAQKLKFESRKDPTLIPINYLVLIYTLPSRDI